MNLPALVRLPLAGAIRLPGHRIRAQPQNDNTSLFLITATFILHWMDFHQPSISQSISWRGVFASILLSLITHAAVAQQQMTSNTATGVKTWSLSHAGVHFSLTQILSEQGDAFYVNRGFSLDQIAPFTSSCVFMTVLRNDAATGTVHFVRSNWQVRVDGQPHRFKTVAEWLEFFRARQIAKSALIAFQWAQFPPEQEYEPGGDWNQGMLSVGLGAGQSFDITANWDIDSKPDSATLTGVECAQ